MTEHPSAEMTRERQYTYSADAVLLRGDLECPVGLKIERQASVSLRNHRGGHLIRRMGQCSIDGLISFQSGYTSVSGSYSEQHGWMTLSTSVLGNLNVLEVISAERVVAQVSTEHQPYDRVPKVTFPGTRFENLRVGGYAVQVELDRTICGYKPEGDRSYLEDHRFLDRVQHQFENIARSNDLPRDLREMYDRNIASIDVLREHANYEGDKQPLECSLIKSIAPIPIPGVRTIGNLILIPDFGVVSLANFEVGFTSWDNTVHTPKLQFVLNMLRIRMGCIAHGTISAAEVFVSGAKAFGGGGGTAERAQQPPLVSSNVSKDDDSWQSALTAEGSKEPAGKPKEETELERFTDITLLEGHLYRGDPVSKESRLSDAQPLIAGQPYTLEVAIRLKRTGIDTEHAAPGVRNPRQEKEDLTVFVLADPEWPGIEIKESFARVNWPYNADSESALFQLETKSAEVRRGVIEVRLYNRSLDLLDIVHLLVTVVPPGTDLSNPEVLTRSLSWPSRKQGPLEFNSNSPIRDLSIDVCREEGGYKLLFKFQRNDEVNPVEIAGKSSVSEGDAATLLVRVRDFWTDLSLTNYASDLTVTRTTFDIHLKRLRDLGMRAWTLLFGARHAGKEGASERIGKLLSEMQLKEGTRIQIAHSGAGDFVFPWSILYPPTTDENQVDPFQFWGARYQIEQVIEGPQCDVLTDEPINVVFALDPAFGNAAEQVRLLEAYHAASPQRLLITKPIKDEKTLFQELGRKPSAHLIYFYCHGYAPDSQPKFRGEGVKLMRQRIDKLGQGTPERQALETLLTLTTKMEDEPWVHIGDAYIRESRLVLQEFFETRRPIVFLNMCQSADLLPSMSSGLVRIFLDHNASAVVGTEGQMTSTFANPFAEAIFNALFGGDDIGTSLWKARRHFLSRMHNPLGLAYTLYGRAVARLGTGPIPTAEGPTPNAPAGAS
jgi:hypothetical protein